MGISIASADPIVVPLAKTSAGDLNAVIPSESVLGLILIGQVVSILAYLGKAIWDMFHRNKDKMEEKVDALSIAVQELRAEIKTLSKLPNESEIIERLEERTEWLVFKAVRDMGITKSRLDK